MQYSALSKREDREDQFNMNERIVLKGSVVVTRNPCLHPGDVRQLVAVDVPALRHFVDCVVFPRKGSRPHPNEMAGNYCQMSASDWPLCVKWSTVHNLKTRHIKLAIRIHSDEEIVPWEWCSGTSSLIGVDPCHLKQLFWGRHLPAMSWKTILLTTIWRLS